MNIERKPTIGGLQHARDLNHKMWKKERQRVLDLQKRNSELTANLGKLQLLYDRMCFVHHTDTCDCDSCARYNMEMR